MDTVDKAYDSYELKIQHAVGPIRNVNSDVIGGNKNDPFDPRSILALSIDHNH
jgi:hypothetical protein